MILRKPYAFLAKHFKKIHFILTILVAYLVYRTNLIFQFFNQYLQVEENVIGRDLAGPLFNIFMFLIPFLWILLSIIILSLMFTKKKPITFYLVNILMAFGVLVLYVYTNNTILLMETRLVDVRVVRALRDIVMGVMLAQAVVTCMVLMRATGFDVKKFNFGEDLAGLEVEEGDREEFEVNLEIDTDKTKRQLRRNFRYAKYVYVENRYLINLVSLVVIVIISFVTFMNLAVYHKTYSASNRFTISGINMQVQNVYSITQDYKGKQITEPGISLVVLNLNLKKVAPTKKQLEKATAILFLNGKKYYPVDIYRDKLVDLGKTYELEELDTTPKNYLLVYEVPTKDLKKKMEFEYSDKNTFNFGVDVKSVTVKIGAKNLEGNRKSVELKKNEEKVLKESVLGESKIFISNALLDSKFIHTYQYCPRQNECYESIEHVKPSIINTYEKGLLKLTGNFTQADNVRLLGVYDFYDLIALLGKIEYTLDGVKKVQTLPFKEVVPTRQREKNVYYIEIQKEILNASEIELVFRIRDVDYRYRIK